MKLITSFILILYISAYSQEFTKPELDSLFNLYNRIKNPVTQDARIAPDTSVIKCGFSIVNSVRLNFDNFTPEQQQVLLKLFQRPDAQAEVISPSGYFRVHYDTSGINQIRYNLQQLLEALDSSYNFEVHTLGYPSPKDNGSGGDDKYDIYVRGVGSLYGYTELEGRISSSENRYYSFMVIDNEFSHTASRGIDGARVTVAHELHHGIQIGNYTFSDPDTYFHELSSTAMEEFVYDNINDYYYYMDDFFNATDISLPKHNGYDSAIWNIFLKEQFDYDILKTQWELMKESGIRALDAIALSISKRGPTFQELFNRFGIWIYFTGHRVVEGKYFEEAAKYPVARNVVERSFTPPSDTLMFNAHPVTHNFITLTNNFLQGEDTLTILISNSDYRKAVIDPNFMESVIYELYSDSSEGLFKITDGYFKRFTSPNTAFWATSEFLNNQLVSEGFNRIESATAFPLPFRYNSHSFIYFPVSVNPGNDVELYIYSSSMDLVFNGRKDIFTRFGKNMISWNGRTAENHKLGSGVYLFVIKSGDEYSKGKIVLFND